MIDLDQLRGATPGPWILATSNSWRRIVAQDMTPVCEPIMQYDRHPDLHFRNGGEDGPDARLIAAAPELLTDNARLRAALVELVALEDLEAVAMTQEDMEILNAMMMDHDERKPLAWQAARAAIKGEG